MTWQLTTTTASESSHSPPAANGRPSQPWLMTTLPKWARLSEVAVGVLCGLKRKYPIDHRPQSMLRDRPVHCLEIDATADADRAQRHAAVARHGASVRHVSPLGPHHLDSQT